MSDDVDNGSEVGAEYDTLTSIDKPSARITPPEKSHRCGQDTGSVSLTKNEQLVLNVLNENGGPLKAYQILDSLRDEGVRAPMTVYRALDGLEEKGVIHKLDATNAFVICNHDAPHRLQVFLLCDHCPTVSEIDVDGLEGLLRPVTRAQGYSMDTARLEVRGICESCAERYA